MAIVWMDGFDLYNSTATMALKGYSTVTNGLVAGRFGGQAAQNTGGLTPQTWGVPSGNTFAVGFAFRVGDLSGNTTGKGIFSFQTGATIITKLGVDVNGALKFGRGDFTTNLIANSANGLIAINVWNYIEIEYTRNGATGAVTVYLNGSSVLTASGANTGATAIDTMAFMPEFFGGNKEMDDLYVVDVATRLGESRIDTLRPSADSGAQQWTRSTGANNFANVDDTTLNSDTDYNSSATVANKDLYDVADLGFTPASVRAVQAVMFARKDDATARTIRHYIKEGGTTTNGTTRAMGSSFGMFTDLYATNPRTAAAWSAAEVNATQLGLDVVT